jgi:branched-chain amino acid transport system permease protein
MQWVNAVVQGILLGGLFALFATGLSLAFGVMRFVNLAHGDLAILSAYLAVSTTSALDVNPFVSLLVVVPIMTALGYVLQRFVFNRTVGSDPLPSILVTFGLGIVIQNALLEHYSANSQGLDAGQRIETGSLKINDDIAIGWFAVLILAVAVVTLIGLHLFLQRTRLGRAFRATSDDPSTARLMGINDRSIYSVVMAIAFATVALAGVFLGIRQTFGPTDGPAQLIGGFEAVVIGGLGSLWGTLVGGMVLGLAQTLGNQIDVEFGVITGPLLGHLIFLVVLAFRPNGLLGSKGRS